MSCKCNVGLGNTGTGCTPIAEVAKKLILLEYFKADGTVNGITLSGTTFNNTFWSGKVNHADPKLRWYPLPDMKNVTTERAEGIKETYNDGTVGFVNQGGKSFLGLIINGPAQLQKELETARCVDVGIFVIDKDGNLLGNGSVAGVLQPFKLDKDSFSTRLIPATDTTLQKLEVGFNYSVDEKDEDIVMITAAEMTDSPINLKGLLDISHTVSGISTTGFTSTLKTKYGTPLNPVLDKGLLITDFAIYNVTDSAAVTILTMVETNGVYAFTFAAQTVADVLRLTPTKVGRSYTDVIAATVTIA